MFKQMYEKIKKAKHIYIYRHINSDFDALGSQFGLKRIITASFDDKLVYCMGAYNPDLCTKMNIKNEEVVFEKRENSLAIVLDTANHDRIDGIGYDLCDDMIKVDHHIIVDSYANLNIEFEHAASCSELIVKFYLENKEHLILTKTAASWLYFGIIGDTNRFLYDAVSSDTMNMAGVLLDTGFDRQAVHNAMYLRDMKELRVTQYILNHFVYDEGIAYYIMEQEDLDQLDVSRSVASSFVNTLSNITEVLIWASLTYEKENDQYRVSIRSRNIKISDVAAKYHGGGHEFASGCRLGSLKELPLLIQDLKGVL